MNVFVGTSSAIFAVLGDALGICLILFVASYIIRRRRRSLLPVRAQSKIGNSLRGMISKLSEISWGRCAIGIMGWYIIGAFVLVGAAMVAAGFMTVSDFEPLHPPVTEENSPVNMFLQLDEDITLDEVMAQEDDRDWYYSGSAVSGEDTGVADVTIRPAWSEESGMHNSSTNYALYEESNCEILKMNFAVGEDGSSRLMSAQLLIKTDDGTASCYYYPTDYTEWGGETGFNLTVKGHGMPIQHKYLLDTAQEVMDIVYPLVYPNGY